jgi:hypothetical protein
MPRFSRFHVLCSDSPKRGRKYRQIVAGPSDDRTFHEVRIFEGEVVQLDPDFNAVGTDAEYYSHATAEEADKDADAERDRSLATGWRLYSPETS